MGKTLVTGNRRWRREGRRSRRIIRVPVIILMYIVAFMIVLLLVNDRAGCDMRRLHDPGLGRPTQLHDIARRKYYLRWRTDHCEGRAHGSGRGEARQSR